jgi:hypothetical protein
MGDIADMMLDGTLCEGCGVFMGEAVDFPRLCRSCANERKADGRMIRGTGIGGYQDIGARPEPPKAKVKCPTCGRKVKHNGLLDHQRDAHGVKR